MNMLHHLRALYKHHLVTEIEYETIRERVIKFSKSNNPGPTPQERIFGRLWEIYSYLGGTKEELLKSGDERPSLEKLSKLLPERDTLTIRDWLLSTSKPRKDSAKMIYDLYLKLKL